MAKKNIINLGARRYGKSNCWKPIELLRDALEQVETKEIDPLCMTIWYWNKEKNGMRKLCHFTSAQNTDEIISLLSHAQHYLLHSGRKDD